MKILFIILIFLLNVFLLFPAQSSTKTKITIKELMQGGYELTHVSASDNRIYYIFVKDKEIYSCSGKNSSGLKCFHLTDGK